MGGTWKKIREPNILTSLTGKSMFFLAVWRNFVLLRIVFQRTSRTHWRMSRTPKWTPMRHTAQGYWPFRLHFEKRIRCTFICIFFFVCLNGKHQTLTIVWRQCRKLSFTYLSQFRQLARFMRLYWASIARWAQTPTPVPNAGPPLLKQTTNLDQLVPPLWHWTVAK